MTDGAGMTHSRAVVRAHVPRHREAMGRDSATPINVIAENGFTAAAAAAAMAAMATATAAAACSSRDAPSW